MNSFDVPVIPLQSIIRFESEEDPFSLIDITQDVSVKIDKSVSFLQSPGYYIYESRFTIDEFEALRQGVTGIRFEFFSSPPSASDVPSRGNDFTVEIKSPIVSTPSDPQNVQKAAIYLNSSILLRDPATAEILSRDVSPIKAVSIQQPLAENVFKQTVKFSETIDRQDPAQSLSAGKILGTTPKNVMNFGIQDNPSSNSGQNFDVLGSSVPENEFSLSKKRTASKMSRSSSQDTIVNSFLNLKRIVDPNSLVRTLPVAMVEVLSNNVEYVRQFRFDKSGPWSGNTVYVRVSGILKNKIASFVENVIYTISHQSELRDFMSNPEPPEVIASESSFNKASFTLRKNDPTLRRVVVVRITKNPNLVEDFIESVATLNFENEEFINFEDNVDNVAPNTVIYRFVVKNEDDSSGEFTSTVLNSFTKVSDQKKVLSSTTPISIRAINTIDGIDIEVDTTNDQVYSLRLLRQDLGLTGEFSSTVKTVLSSDGRYSQIVAGEKTTLKFLDSEVINGRHYRYFAAYRLGSGAEASLCQETISDEDEVIVRIRQSNDTPFSAAMTPVSISQDVNNSLTLEFETSVQEKDEFYNVLIEALRQAGVSQQFILSLQNDKQKMKQVAVFLVERIDRLTGKRVTLGLFPPGKVSDSPANRDKLKVPDPIAGRKYEYVCKLCIRPDKTFLLTATAGFTATGDTSGDITEVLASKFQNALIQRGILPSEKQLRQGLSIKEQFLTGQSGVEISQTIALPKFGPSIDNLIIRERKKYNLVKWSTSGDISGISYFLIYCNYNGVDELLGAISSVNENSVYQYKDTRLCDEVGQKSYFVKFVTLGHDVSISSSKVETITEFSLPRVAFDGYILSPSRYEVQGVIFPGPGPQNQASAGRLSGQVLTSIIPPPPPPLPPLPEPPPVRRNLDSPPPPVTRQVPIDVRRRITEPARVEVRPEISRLVSDSREVAAPKSRQLPQIPSRQPLVRTVPPEESVRGHSESSSSSRRIEGGAQNSSDRNAGRELEKGFLGRTNAAPAARGNDSLSKLQEMTKAAQNNSSQRSSSNVPSGRIVKEGNSSERNGPQSKPVR